jgi:hypothetical protein
MPVLTWAFLMHLATNPSCTFPGMVPPFWPAVVHQEARQGIGYNPFALHDDTADRSYYPDTADEAEMIARRLMATGHSVGVGLSQLTARNEAQFQYRFGLTIQQALDACTNMNVGAHWYVRGALQIYNSGRPNGAPLYAARVEARLNATPLPAEPERHPDPPKASIFARPTDSRELIFATTR